MIPKLISLLTDIAAATTGDAYDFGLNNTPNAPKATFHAVQTGTGAQTSTTVIEVSNDKVRWITAATFTLSDTTTAQSGFVLDAPWRWVRARCSAITGTDKALNVTMGLV